MLCILPIKPTHAEMRKLPSITVLSASSLTDVLSEIIRIYSQEKNITVTGSFGATADLAKKIKDGRAADIFISAYPKWMTELKQHGLIDVYSLTNLVENKLVIATSQKTSTHFDENVSIENILQTLSKRTLLVIGDPNSVPLGIYAKQTLEAIGLWQAIEPRLIREESASSARYLIAKGNGTGIIYKNDAYNNNEVQIVKDIPKDLHEPIVYQAAVVAGENMTYARHFLDFLKSDQANTVFKNYGFEVE